MVAEKHAHHLGFNEKRILELESCVTGATSCIMRRAPRPSFCCTCMGRAHPLKITLPVNLATLSRFPDAEIVLVNYNSPDDLDSWIRDCMVGSD